MRILIAAAFIIVSTHTALFAQTIAIRQANEGKEVKLWVKNTLPCAISLTVTSDSLSINSHQYLPENSERVLTTVPARTVPASLAEIPFTYSFTLGNPHAVHDSLYRYSLPFPEGNSYELIQGNNGEFSHNVPSSQYAFDFKMPIGSIVTAARGGVVGYVEEDFPAGGTEEKFLSKANRVLVCHDDGSVSMYVHLKQNGALVQVGDPVYAGQVIGFSGNSGYSSTPHLHFAVLIGDRSVPILFYSHPELQVGKFYEH
ncbi:MAG TPA: M23 family metallopeptidase [Balneolaceae bacterium]